MASDFDFLLTYERFDFAKCTPCCSRSQMSALFLEKLEKAYDIYPFVLTSAYRSREYERKHGRSGTSAHVLGRAVDVATPDSRTRFYVLMALIEAGFSRFGIGPRFIHVDDDVCSSRPDRCIFLDNLVEKK